MTGKDPKAISDLLHGRYDHLEDLYADMAPRVLDEMFIREMGDGYAEFLSKALNRLAESGAHRHGMTDAQLTRLYTYTLRSRDVPAKWSYSTLNDKLRSGNQAVYAGAILSRTILNNALDKLPDYDGEVYRGLKFDDLDVLDVFLEDYKAGAVVTYSEFISAGARKPYPGRVQLVIRSRHGKRIADYSGTPGDDEVLFRAGAKFRVLDILPEEERTFRILLEEED